MKIIIFLLLLFFISVIPSFSAEPPPPEIAMIILMENKFENSYRNKDFIKAKDLIENFYNEKVNDLILKLSSNEESIIKNKFSQLNYSILEKNILKVEEAYIDFKNNLYLLYDLFELDGISPELNFLIFDLNQLLYYYNNNYYEFIVLESKQIMDFVSLIHKRLIEKQILIPEIKYLYNYILRLLSQISAAALDKDNETLKYHINLLEKCFDELKISYETKKFNRDFNR